jgi:hypothetical protein
MAHYLDKKQLSDFKKKIQNVFHFLTISGKYKIIGSAALKSILYNSDFDLMELVKKSKDTPTLLNHIYQLFLRKFREAEADPSIFITDFKCGKDSNGEPLRWSKQDMEKGYKIKKNKKHVYFQETLIQKSTIKLDAIVLIDGVFTEFSDNYLLKLGQESNFEESEVTREGILNGIKQSYNEYIQEKDYFKAVKRAFSYKLILDPKKYKDQLVEYIDLFNSPLGYLNKCRSDLDILLLVLENKYNFRKPKISDIINNLQIIKATLVSITSFNLKEIIDDINIISAKTSHNDLSSELTILRDELFNEVNEYTKMIISKNKYLVKL